jgi:heme/copper-type cytochrome/quinol oxidase subunit 2
MSYEAERNYVSVGSWMWMMFVSAIPIVGVIMIFVWAFTGENESRKNYCRAILAWFAVLVGIVVVLALIGQWPHVQYQLRHLMSWR